MKIYRNGAIWDWEKAVSDRIGSLINISNGTTNFLVVYSSDRLEAIAWIIASFFVPGIVAVPLSNKLTKEAESRLLTHLPFGKIFYSNDLQKQSGVIPAMHKPLSEEWLVIFSSGTTGEAKGVAIEGKALQASAQAHGEHFSEQALKSWELNIPLFHIGGFSIVTRAFFLDTEVILNEANSEQVLQAEGISLVPSQIAKMTDSELFGLKRFKIVLVGGGFASAAVLEKLNHFSISYRLTYGLTENCSQFATEKISGSGMMPLKGMLFRITERGEILLSSPAFARGYYRNGNFFPLNLKHGWLATGDMGRAEGSALAINGRSVEMMVTGGLNVYPAEIELFSGALENVFEMVVSCIPDPIWGEKIVAMVVLRNPGELFVEEWKKALSKLVDVRKIPKEWIEVTDIPKTESGKPQRSKIREILLSKVSK